MNNNKLAPTVEDLPQLDPPAGLLTGPAIAVAVGTLLPGPQSMPRPITAITKVMIEEPNPSPEPDPGDFPDPEDEPIIVYPPIPHSGPVGPG